MKRKLPLILKTVTPSWKAAAWFLETRFPAEFGRKKSPHCEVSDEERALEIQKALKAYRSID
jgi:hypothetical protein